jgi:hypothetical protein
MRLTIRTINNITFKIILFKDDSFSLYEDVNDDTEDKAFIVVSFSVANCMSDSAITIQLVTTDKHQK